MENELTLHAASPYIRQADLLLFRGKSPLSRVIAKATRSRFSHAAKVDILDRELWCAEVREFKGGRLVTLASQVLKYPGQIDVWRADPDGFTNFNRKQSALYMRRFVGEDYGWWSVIQAGLTHLTVARLFGNWDYALEGSQSPSQPPYCSQACAMADRHGGGVDPAPGLADRFTTPADLTRGGFYKYFCTLRGV